MSTDKKKWRLHFGIHDGTITSREDDVNFFDSEQEAREKFQKSKKRIVEDGYVIWFAHLYSPTEEKFVLDEGSPYRS